MDFDELWVAYNAIFPNTVTLDVLYAAVDEDEAATAELLLGAIQSGEALSDSDLGSTPAGVYL